MDIDELHIERLTKERLRDVQQLIRAAFGRKVSLEYLNAKYDTLAMCGIAYVCHVAYIGNQAVGFVGVLPMRAQLNGEVLLVGQSCDYFTHPDFQKRGIFSKLLTKNNELLVQLDIHFQFAFTSDMSGVALLNKGWKQNGEMMRFHLRRRGIPFLKVIYKFTFLNTLRKWLIQRAFSAVELTERMENPAADEYHLWIPFSDDFIVYKNQLGNTIITIDGCKLWMRITNIIQVGAIHGLTNENIEAVLDGLKRIARKLGVLEVVIQEFEGTATYHQLREKVQPETSFPIVVFSSKNQPPSYQPNLIEFDSFL